MQLIDLFQTAATAGFRANKLRSLLTVLGIVIGIAAVILMLSIGRSAEGLILNQVADLGADLVFAEPYAGDPTSGPPDPFIEQSLRLKDVDFLEDTGVVRNITPFVQSTATVTHDQESSFVQIVGTNEYYVDVFPAVVESGRFIDQADVDGYAHVAVLGSEIAVDLFGEQDPVGRRVKIKNTTFRVIGVFPEQGTRFFQNLDQQIAVPVTSAQRDLFGIDYVNYFVMQTVEGIDIEIVKDEVRYAFRDAHDIDNPEADPDKDDVFVSSQSDAVEIIGVIGDVLSILLAAIASISLLVGGIGIMNIMLVSVTERTKEIGLRKSVGATRREILQQFLLESVLLTLSGGIIGVLLGVFGALFTGLIVREYVEGWEATVPLGAVLLGVVVATTVGIVFGIYPASRAAKLDPIEALRYE